MDKRAQKKMLQLGMPFGTASNRLRKMVLFNLLVKHGENVCFQCGETIGFAEHLTIEHKKPWLDNDTELFWDIDNIGFSHHSCNVAASTKVNKGIFSHPSSGAYRRGCRCQSCRDIEAKRSRIYRASKKV